MNPYVKRKILEFLEEDLRYWDLASELLPDFFGGAEIIVQSNGVIAGIEEIKILYEQLNCEVEEYTQDGADVKKGECVVTVLGSIKNILEGERTALNILMRMSGIATYARELLRMARSVNPDVRIVGTRKTAPGLRYFDKKAIFLGSGSTHRFGLDDCLLIKDNHLKNYGIRKALKLAREREWVHKIEIEIHDLKDVIPAAESGADIIMVDNFKEEDVKKADALLRKKKLRNKVILEASGQLNEKNIKKYAKYVDVLSVGALTHSVKSLNISMNLKS